MQLNETPFRALIIGAALVLVVVLIRFRFYGDFDLPPKPAKPAAVVSNANSVSKSLSRSSEVYQKYLDEDAARFGIARVSSQTMSAVFSHKVDTQQRELAVGDSVKVLGLELTLSEGKIRGSRRSHLMLKIANSGFKALAYRIDTRPSSGARSCAKMSQIPHNAVAIAAGGVEERAECLFREGLTLEINRVETVELPELGFHYVSSVAPDILGLEDRNSRLHKRPTDAMPCDILQSASMRKAVASGQLSWRDQIDFYARHRCLTYSLPRTYKAFQRDGEQNLPFSEGDL